MGKYISQREAVWALGPQTVLAIYDDDNTGTLNAEALEFQIERAEAMVDSHLLDEYKLPITQRPAAVDRLIKHAALEFLISFSFERHPEYVRTFGEDQRAQRYKRGLELMDRIVSAIQQLPDERVIQKPANIGGIVFDNAPRVIVDSLDGTRNMGDF